MVFGCSSYHGHVTNGRYVSPNNKISVALPKSIKNPVIYDHIGQKEGFVDFVKPINKRAVTKYSLEWRDKTKNEDFYASTKRYLPSYLHTDLADYQLGNFSIISDKKFKIGSHLAEQFIAVNSASQYSPAVWAVTIIDYRDKVLFAYTLQPRNPNIAAAKQITWSAYNKFLNSIHNFS